MTQEKKQPRDYIDEEVAAEKEMLALEASRYARDRFGRVDVMSRRDATYDP